MTKTPVFLEQRPLGHSGHPTSILGLGIRRLGEGTQKEFIAVVREAIDKGVNVIETTHEYAEGRTEKWLGLALADGYRQRVNIVAQCCAHRRDYKTAMIQLEETMVRLKTDRIDLWTFHEVIYDNDPDWIYDHGGLDAMQEAREQGKVRFIGFGGHKSPHIHLKLLQRGFNWDAVLMPLNPLDGSFRSFEKQVLPETIRRGAAVIGIKPMASGALLDVKGVKPEESLRYCLSLPVSSVITGMDSLAVLRKNLKAVTDLKSFHAGEMDAMRQKARSVAGDGRSERYKTTQEQDLPAGLAAHEFTAPSKKK
ncbi:MAG: aldo/keto reductase [Gemmatimonadetes bacterium]|jgi:predicted aldo/keto reductase-like oxidoreductase|nr:aldo/keto reductase [Gemmatimonadota bacterium]